MRNLIVVCGLALLLAACNGTQSENQQPKGRVIARVDKQVLTLEQIRSAYGAEAWDSLTSQEKRDQIQAWVDLTLLGQEADHLGLGADQGIQFRIDSANKKIKANAMMSKKMPTVEPSEDELFAWYTSHKNDYIVNDSQYKIQRIFVRSRAKADQVLNELRSGMESKQAAGIYSEEAAGKNGGFMGMQSKADYDQATWDQIIKLEKGVFGIVNDPRGFYVIRWYEQQEASQIAKEFLDVKAEIRAQLIQKKKEDTLRTLLERLKTQSDIEISL